MHSSGENDSDKFVVMKWVIRFFVGKNFTIAAVAVLLSCFFFQKSFSQQPNLQSNIHATHVTPVFLLSITPKNGGKSYTLFHKTKVSMKLKDGTEVNGKVLGVSHDSIAVDSKSFAVKDIDELSFNPGSIIGVIAAVATTVGLIAIAITVDGGKDGIRSSEENTVFYSGIGFAVVGGAVLIPKYFIKKHFTGSEYDFAAVMIGGY